MTGGAAAERVLIVGAGVGGLALAAELSRHRVAFQVVERRPKDAPQGAGLAIWPRAAALLERVGALPGLLGRAQPIEHAELRRSDGVLLKRVPLGWLRAHGSLGLLATTRDALQDALLGAVPHEAIRWETDCSGVTDLESDSKQLVRVDIEGADSLGGAAVVGADGLYSRVRSALHGDAPPRSVGRTSWRGVVTLASEDIPDVVAAGPPHYTEWLGRGRRIGLFPTGDAGFYWYLQVNLSTLVAGVDLSSPTLPLELVGDFAPAARRVVEATRASDLIQTDLYDRPALRRWGRGRVTLLGDACHPMTPDLGHGACLAIEDAGDLAAALAAAQPTEWEPALRDYERRRRKRSARFQRASRLSGRARQLENGLARGVRNLALRLVPWGLATRLLRPLVCVRRAGRES